MGSPVLVFKVVSLMRKEIKNLKVIISPLLLKLTGTVDCYAQISNFLLQVHLQHPDST